jgi:hypothetical protein
MSCNSASFLLARSCQEQQQRLILPNDDLIPSDNLFDQLADVHNFSPAL